MNKINKKWVSLICLIFILYNVYGQRYHGRYKSPVNPVLGLKLLLLSAVIWVLFKIIPTSRTKDYSSTAKESFGSKITIVLSVIMVLSFLIGLTFIGC